MTGTGIKGGHCLCGATRYALEADRIRWQGLCHCASCRRASGAPVVGWLGVPDGHWRWTGQAPGQYASSPGVVRGFCTTCGTPLTYASSRWPDETHFLAATLDDPADFAPTAHFHAGEALHWLHIKDDLKRHDQTVSG
jgi:hypothetical protein